MVMNDIPLRRFTLQMDVVLEEVNERLRPYIGVVCDIADHTALLEAALGEILGPPPIRSVRSLLEPYSLPTEALNALQDALVIRVYMLLQRSLVALFPSRTYLFQFTPHRTIVIDEYPRPPAVAQPPITDDWASESGWTPRTQR